MGGIEALLEIGCVGGDYGVVVGCFGWCACGSSLAVVSLIVRLLRFYEGLTDTHE